MWADGRRDAVGDDGRGRTAVTGPDLAIPPATSADQDGWGRTARPTPHTGAAPGAA